MDPKLKQALTIAIGVLGVVEPHVADFFSPSWQPKVVSILAMLVGCLTLVKGVLDTAAKDAPLVAAAASGSLGDKAKALALDPKSAKANQAGFARLPGLMVLAGVAMVAAGCAWFQAHGAQTVADIAKIVQCVATEQQANVQPAQIALDCGMASAQDVINLIQTLDQRAASKYPACVGDAGAK